MGWHYGIRRSQSRQKYDANQNNHRNDDSDDNLFPIRVLCFLIVFLHATTPYSKQY